MISESTMKAAKRNRNSNYITRETVYNPSTEDLETEIKYNFLPEGPHAPNKQEAKALRRICSQTGLTAKEVREHKKYRKELAQAAKSSHVETGVYKSPTERAMKKIALRLRKEVAREQGISHKNPNFFEFFKEKWKTYEFIRYDICAKEAFDLVN